MAFHKTVFRMRKIVCFFASSLKRNMTYKTLFYLAYLALTFSSCLAQNTMKKDAQPTQENTLHPLSKTSLDVQKGDVFYYGGAVHGSVGIAIEYEIANKSIVKFHHDSVDYKNKDAVEKGMSGADEATKIFAFEALQKGETTITINELFRGTVENSFTFKINVK
jgi:hypothetical protein